MTTLERTFNPKLTRYSPDGKGRDRYIAFDNGGLLPGSLPRLSSQSRAVFPRFQPPRVSRPEATVHTYISDGSGRDYYITVSGSCRPNPSGSRNAFQSSLRTDLRRTYIKPEDFFARSNQGWLSPSGRSLKSRKRRVLSEVTSRLYTPRMSSVGSRASSPEAPRAR